MRINKLLCVTLLLSCAVSAINVILIDVLVDLPFEMYMLPMANMTFFRLDFLCVGFAYGMGNIAYLIPIFLMFALILTGMVSVMRNGRVLPAICCAIYGFDLIFSGWLLVSDLPTGFINPVSLISIVTDGIVIALFALYFFGKNGILLPWIQNRRAADL